MTKPKPLSEAERMLLDGFLDVLRAEDEKSERRASRRFGRVCDFLEHATAAARSLVRLRRLK